MICFTNCVLFRATPFLSRVFWGFALAALLCYFFIDHLFLERVTPFLKRSHPLFMIISCAISPPLCLTLSLGCFLWSRLLSKKKRCLLLFFELLVAQMIATTFVRVCKVIVGRARPESVLSNGFLGFDFFSFDPYFHSFPSGHAAIAFTLSGSITLCFPSLRFFALLIASIFAFSRVFLLKHFPSDLFITGMVSLLIARTVHFKLKEIQV